MKLTSEHDLHLGKWLGGAALGALAMYMMDPDRGGPRRALSGAALRKLGRQGGDMLDKVVQGVGEGLGTKVLGGADGTAGAGASGSNEAHGASTADERGGAGGTADHPRHGSDSPDGGRLGMRAAKAMLGNDAGRRTFSSGSFWRSSPRNAAMLGDGMPVVASMLMRRVPFAMAVGMAGLALLMRSMRHASLSNERAKAL